MARYGSQHHDDAGGGAMQLLKPDFARVITPDDIDFAAYEHETDAKSRVRPAAAYIGELIDRIGVQQHDDGIALPWPKTRGLFAFRPGEVTLWAGVNGHGKSLMTGMVMCHLIFQLQRVCIASFEMKPHTTLQRMLRQWVGYAVDDEFAAHPEAKEAIRELYEQFAGQSDGRLWLYDQQGTVASARVQAMARYCAKELGVQHILIDSLMKCVRGTDDYTAQKEFVGELCAIAMDYGIHIHLVHHIRKLTDELKVPDKTDVKGAGEITDQVDNVLLVWRNKADQLARSKTSGDADAALICCKQRNGTGWEGGVNLWFHHASRQYVDAAGAGPINFAEIAR